VKNHLDSILRNIAFWHTGILPQWVLLASALVLVTAAIVALAVVQAVSRQVNAEVDRRLIEGAAAFQAVMDDKTADVLALAQWLASEPAVQAAIDGEDLSALSSLIADPLRLPDVDEVVVARPDGSVLAALRADGHPGPGSLEGPGFLEARTGRDASGIGSDDEDRIAIRAYTPVGDAVPAAVIRIGSLLDAVQADRFHVRTGLHITLFFGQERVVSTLRDIPGQPLDGSNTNFGTYRQVVDDGRPVLTWRDLPIGQLRSYSLPLAGPDDRRVGMISVQLPVEAIQLQLRDALLPVAPLAVIAILLAGAAGFLLIQRMYRPVLALAEAASRLRHGDLATPIPAVTQQELVPLAEELEHARVRIQQDVEHHLEISRLREQLLFHVAHELRGPMTVLDNALELLSGAPEDENVRRRMLPLARRNARQITSLTGNLLSAANIQSGRFVIHPERIDLSEVVETAARATLEMTQIRGQTVNNALRGCNVWVMADPEYVQLAMANLLANASKYSAENGDIEIAAERIGSRVRVAVRDAGRGIPIEQQPRIFETFYRAPGERREPGLGLGLSIVREVAEAHGGTVGVQSTPGQGTIVWLTLPALDE
jgi:signal transduction histidine kinase